MNEVLVTKISLLFYQYPCKSALLFSLSKRALFKEGEQCQLHRSGVFIVSLDKISHIVLVFLLLSLNKQMPPRVTVLVRVYIFVFNQD